MLDREPARVHRQQREDLGLPPVEQQPLPVEPHLGRAEQRQREAGVGGRRGAERCRTTVRWQRALDQPRHHARRREADGVGAVPGRRQVDDAERAAGHRVEDRRGPAHPVVHDLGVVLGAEDHRRGAGPAGDGERVGADARLVPAPAGHEVHRLGLAAHHPAAVGPEDAGLLVGDRDDEVAVLGRTAQLVLHPGHRGLQGRVVPELGGVALVGERRVGHGRRDHAGELPAAEDLRPHGGRLLAAVDELRPGAHGTHPACVQVVTRRHGGSPRVAANLARV